MITEENREIVVKSSLFTGLDSNQIASVIESAKELSFEPGQTIIEEGDNVGNIYILVDGKVQVEKRVEDWLNVRIIHTREIGTMLGEMSLVDMKPRSATVRAETPVTMVEVNRQELSALFDRDPRAFATVSLNIARTLAERVRISDKLISNFLTGNE